MKYVCFYSPSGTPMVEGVSDREAREMKFMYNLGIVDFIKIVNKRLKAEKFLHTRRLRERQMR